MVTHMFGAQNVVPKRAQGLREIGTSVLGYVRKNARDPDSSHVNRSDGWIQTSYPRTSVS